ncbi:putative UDP-glucose 6-dehydrogenase [Echria macrotheca]|uniref:UDP-glucose 6-dehydrogenase n=1 Tax=Echria macrotheca TaxID=438768 RepID=A0AAJ0BFW5_9PEZI|nr:putative UDP-glucose 6-dehydrogenase [Echria macrotheca]
MNHQHSESEGPTSPSTTQEFPPRSHSTDSAPSPGIETPNSWKPSPWTQHSPATTPPSSESGSPETKPDASSHDGGDTCSTEPRDSTESHELGEAKNICFLGAGFVGGPTAAVIAYHNPEITVNVVDLDEARIAAWNSRLLPIHEQGLLKVVRVTRDGTHEISVVLPGRSAPVRIRARRPNLLFSTRVVDAVSEADIIFICVNTPTKTQGVGAGSMADVSAVETASRTVAKHAKAGSIVVEKSTVPCGTARMIQDILRYHRPDTTFEVLSNPEFLSEGTAVENLMHPDRILIGSSQTPSGLHAASVLKRVYTAWVPAARIVTVNTFSSELAKLVANAMLAQRISSINAVSAICDAMGLGADVEDVSLALGRDRRLGPSFLEAGVGFGGSCFEKDILSLAYLARELHLDVVSDYWLAVLRINEHQRGRFARDVVRELNGSLRGKKIAVLGFAFKDGTNDTRNSIAVHVIRDIGEEMPREIAVFDPGCAADDIRDEVQKSGLGQTQLDRIKVVASWREAVREATAVCVLTQWKQFRGRQAAQPARLSRALRSKSRHGFSLRFDPRLDGLTEMQVRELEEHIGREIPGSEEDPLGRLQPLDVPNEDSDQAKGSSGHVAAEDVVDWVEAAAMMQEPRWVFDGRNVVNLTELQGLGFRVRGVGKGPWMG